MLTLAEHESPVTIRTVAGRQCGTITSVTGSLCTLDVLGGVGLALIPVAQITAIDGAFVEINDDRTPVATTDLPTVLAELAPERPPVVLHLCDGTAVAGTLAVVGADVVSVAIGSGAGRTVTHVPVGAIASCVVP